MAQRFEILRADAIHDLTSDIGGAVVRAADIDRAAISWRAGPLWVKVYFANSIRSGYHMFAGAIPFPVIVAPASQHVVPSLLIECKWQNLDVAATGRRLEASNVVNESGSGSGLHILTCEPQGARKEIRYRAIRRR